MFEEVRLDINSIKEEKSGTIDEYLEKCDDDWNEHIENYRKRC
jgi:hypothetical protein